MQQRSIDDIIKQNQSIDDIIKANTVTTTTAPTKTAPPVDDSTWYGKAWDWLNKGLVSPENVQKITNLVVPQAPFYRAVTNAVIPGASNTLEGMESSLTSPASLGLLALGGGEVAAAKAGLPALAKGAAIGTRLASIPYTAEGVKNLLGDTPKGQNPLLYKSMAGLQSIGGMLGMFHDMPNIETNVKPQVRIPIEMGEESSAKTSTARPGIDEVTPKVPLQLPAKGQSTPTETTFNVTPRGQAIPHDQFFDYKPQAEVEPTLLDAQNNAEKSYEQQLAEEVRKQKILDPEATSKDIFSRAVDAIRRNLPNWLNSDDTGHLIIDPEKRPNDSPVPKLIEALYRTRILSQEQAANISAEKSQRMAAAMNAGGEGELWARKTLGALSGEYSKINSEALKLNQGDVDQLYSLVKNSGQPFWKQVNAITGLGKLLNGKVATPSETNPLIDIFNQHLGKQLGDEGYITAEMLLAPFKSAPGIAKTALQEAVNIPRTLLPSMDVSLAFRQGIGAITYKDFWKALPTYLKSFGSEDFTNEVMKSVESNPGHDLARLSGVPFTDLGTDVSQREEMYSSRILGMIPGIKNSARSGTAFLNKLRQDLFNSLTQDAFKAGFISKSPEDLQAALQNSIAGKESIPISNADVDALSQIGNLIGNMTGRGSYGSLERYSPLISNSLFSGRLAASRLRSLANIANILDPRTYLGSQKFVRQQALRSLFGIAGFGLTTSNLLKTYYESQGKDANIGTDPISTDFGKLKIGDTRFDAYGGYQQYVALAAQLLAMSKTNSVTNRYQPFNRSYTSPTITSTLGGFVEKKLNPALSFAIDLARGKDFIGNQIAGFNPRTWTNKGIGNLQEESVRRMIPMVVQDLIDIGRTDPDLIPLAALGFGGTSAQVYGPRASSEANPQMIDFIKSIFNR